MMFGVEETEYPSAAGPGVEGRDSVPSPLHLANYHSLTQEQPLLPGLSLHYPQYLTLPLLHFIYIIPFDMGGDLYINQSGPELTM